MRYSVFARRANPSVDRPIIRKSLRHLELQVADLLADWVDPKDHTRGIICRELLAYSGLPREPIAEPVSDRMPSGEIPGCRFVLPVSARHEVFVDHLCRLIPSTQAALAAATP